jgi:hypothetical protein
MWAWLLSLVCRIRGHYWASDYGPEWVCMDCKKRITSVAYMGPKDHFHVGTGVGDG